MNDVTGMPQSAVVLGGSSDLARALLARLAGRRLKRVLLAGRDKAALESVAKELAQLGLEQLETAELDVRAAEGHDAFVERAVERLGEIDLVVLAAGALGTSDLEVLDAASVAALAETNFSGAAGLLLAFSKALLRQGHGQIVVYSSATVMRPRRANFVYGAAKAGIDAFGQGLADTLAGSGVHVLIVRPGFVLTKMTAGQRPAPFSTDAETVAGEVIRALERRAEVVWIPRVLGILAVVVKAVPRAIWRTLPL